MRKYNAKYGSATAAAPAAIHPRSAKGSFFSLMRAASTVTTTIVLRIRSGGLTRGKQEASRPRSSTRHLCQSPCISAAAHPSADQINAALKVEVQGSTHVSAMLG